MQLAAKPTNETQRVATLNQLALLNGKPEKRFDRITRVLAASIKVPVAMVNMITPEQQINKSCFGVTPGFEMDRDTSFCGHTILSSEPLIIEDMLLDERFKDNPNVTGGLKVRSYAGVPLRALDGTHPGTLCLIDTVPRHFTEAEVSLLKDLSAWAEIELNSSQLREALDELSEAHESLEVQLSETRRLNDLMVGRELKMVEMKEQIAKLEAQLTKN